MFSPLEDSVQGPTRRSETKARRPEVQTCEAWTCPKLAKRAWGSFLACHKQHLRTLRLRSSRPAGRTNQEWIFQDQTFLWISWQLFVQYPWNRFRIACNPWSPGAPRITHPAWAVRNKSFSRGLRPHGVRSAGDGRRGITRETAKWGLIGNSLSNNRGRMALKLEKRAFNVDIRNFDIDFSPWLLANSWPNSFVLFWKQLTWKAHAKNRS